MCIKRVLPIIILVIALGFGVCLGYRIPKPQRITDFDDNGLVIINEALEQLWDLSNGRFSFNEGALASSGTGTIKMGTASNANSAGFIKLRLTNDTVVYVPYFTDDTP